jgi:hypothetical protein
MWIMGVLILWCLVITISAVVGLGFIISRLFMLPIWVAALIGIIFFIVTIPLVIFVDFMERM